MSYSYKIASHFSKLKYKNMKKCNKNITKIEQKSMSSREH